MDFPAEPDARAALDATGLRWHPFDRDDLPAIAEFYRICEHHDENPERTSLAGLQEFWDSPRSCPDEDTLVGLDADGVVAATAWAGCNRAITDRRGVYLGGGVRPDRRGEGIGRAVLGWELAHAGAWDTATRQPDFGPLVMRLNAPVGQADVRDLAERFGLATERYFYEMSRPLDGSERAPELDGISLIDWDSARNAEAHLVHDLAFADHWGHVDLTDQESMARFRAAGLDAASLEVDVENPSGALGLYENLGYKRRASTCVHQLTR